MAKLNFDDGAVWDNTQSTDKYTTKVPGHARRVQRSKVFAGVTGLETAGKTLHVLTGTFDFDASYPTGGENIDELWNMMPTGVVSGAIFTNPNVASVRYVVFDSGNKKLIAYTDGASQTQVGAGTNLSAVTGVRWVAWGY